MTTRSKLHALVRNGLGAAALVLAAGAVQAGNVSWSVGIQAPVVGAMITSGPVVYGPAPVVYTHPPLITYQPVPVYYGQPQPVYGHRHGSYRQPVRVVRHGHHGSGWKAQGRHGHGKAHGHRHGGGHRGHGGHGR